jgi:hypothetical protein
MKREIYTFGPKTADLIRSENVMNLGLELPVPLAEVLIQESPAAAAPGRGQDSSRAEAQTLCAQVPTTVFESPRPIIKPVC